MEHNKKNNADTTSKQSANRTEFAEDCHSSTSNNSSNNSSNNTNNKNKNK